MSIRAVLTNFEGELRWTFELIRHDLVVQLDIIVS